MLCKKQRNYYANLDQKKVSDNKLLESNKTFTFG